MFLTKITLKNWRNFQDGSLEIGPRLFLVGPNASGKSNLLDAVRFLKDLAKEGGGLQTAVNERGGLSKIRCLSARRDPNVEIIAEFSTNFESSQTDWKYAITIGQEHGGTHRPILKKETVRHKGQSLLNRPNEQDKQDPARLTQTFLEQINTNKDFREIARLLANIQYLHIVPQLVRHSRLYVGQGVPGDPFGKDFLDKLAQTPKRTRTARLKKIEKALQCAVPQLSQFEFERDERGQAHLKAIYKHWRPKTAGRQREDQFSDGTLRLIGLLWALLDSKSLLLLEEPELSLHAGVVRQLPALMFKILKNKRQVMITTHSPELLDNPSIGKNELAILQPDSEGTQIRLARNIKEIKDLMDSGLSASPALFEFTKPQRAEQLSLALLEEQLSLL